MGCLGSRPDSEGQISNTRECHNAIIAIQSFDRIFFYDRASDHVKEEHIFLNNYAESPITVDGVLYRTVEHYYQVKD